MSDGEEHAADELTERPRLTSFHFLPDLVIHAFSSSSKPGQSGAGRPPLAPLPSAPTASRFAACAVFVDVAGSVRAAQRLLAAAQEESAVHADRRGAEKLSCALNACFSVAISSARRFQGDVLRFLGDAVLIMLYAEAAGGLQAACEAGFKVAAEVAGYEGDDAGLRVHVALAAGHFYALRLGGSGRSEVTVAGEPLARLAAGLSLAQPGELAAAPEVVSALAAAGAPQRVEGGYAVYAGAAPAAVELPGATASGRRRTSTWRGSNAGLSSRGSRRPPLLGPQRAALAGQAAGAEGELAAFLPEDVAAQLAGEGQFLTELRIISCAFVKMDDFAVSEAWRGGFPHETLEWMHRCVAVVLDAARGTEGVVRSCFCDDKGFVCLLTWGLVGTAHSDDPLRACTAALRIREGFELQRCGRASIGVTTGRVFAGLLGDEQRCDYNVLGDPCNMAARLMGKAAGGIWVDSATAGEAARHRLVLRELPPLRVKGSDRPLAAFELLSRAADVPSVDRTAHRALIMSALAAGGAGRPPTLPEALVLLHRGLGAKGSPVLGRRPTMERLARFLAAARCTDGRRGAGVLLLEGDTGTGKTLVASESLRLADEVRLACLVVESDAAEAYPYQPIRQVLRALVDPQGAAVRMAAAKESEERPPGPGLEVTLSAMATEKDSWEVTPGELRPRSPRPSKDLERLRAFLAALDPSGHALATEANAAALEGFLGEQPRVQWGAPREEPEGEGGAPRLLLLLASLFEALARRTGAVLVVDDLHALDSATAQLLAHLAALPISSILVTSRPIPETSMTVELRRIRTCPRTTVIELGPLDPHEEVPPFVAGLLQVEPAGVPDWLVRELGEKSRGNPFALREMVGYLLASGWLSSQGGSLSLSTEAVSVAQAREYSQFAAVASSETEAAKLALPLPDSLERLIVSRLDRLPPTPALVCKLCSALGVRFEHGLASYVLYGYVDGPGVASALEALERHGLLSIAERAVGIREYRFLQSAVVDILYSLLATADRLRVHERAADFLERLSAAGSAAAAQTALHYMAAGLPARAVPHLDACAADALLVGAYPEALKLSRRAIDIDAAQPSAGDPSQAVARARRWQISAQSLFSLGHGGEAGRALERCLRLLGVPLAHEQPFRKALATAVQLARVMRRGPVLKADAGRRRPPELARQRHDVLNGVLSTYSHFLIHVGDAFSGMYYALLNHDVSAEDPESPHYVDACAHMYAVVTMGGAAPARAQEWVRRAEELCATPRCERAFGYLRSEQAAVLLIRGQLADLCSLASSAVPKLRAIADYRALGELLGFHATACHLLGELARAQELHQRALRDARRSNNRMHVTWALVGWASSRLWAGLCDPPTAAALDEALASQLDEARAGPEPGAPPPALTRGRRSWWRRWRCGPPARCCGCGRGAPRRPSARRSPASRRCGATGSCPSSGGSSSGSPPSLSSAAVTEAARHSQALRPRARRLPRRSAVRPARAAPDGPPARRRRAGAEGPSGAAAGAGAADGAAGRGGRPRERSQALRDLRTPRPLLPGPERGAARLGPQGDRALGRGRRGRRPPQDAPVGGPRPRRAGRAGGGGPARLPRGAGARVRGGARGAGGRAAADGPLDRVAAQLRGVAQRGRRPRPLRRLHARPPAARASRQPPAWAVVHRYRLRA